MLAIVKHLDGKTYRQDVHDPAPDADGNLVTVRFGHHGTPCLGIVVGYDGDTPIVEHLRIIKDSEDRKS